MFSGSSAELADFQPDLIILDMYMPTCTGTELAKVIRHNDRYVSVPIIYLSAEDDMDKQLDAMSEGGDDFLTKPIQPRHLITTVRNRAARARHLKARMVRDSLTGLFNHTHILQLGETPSLSATAMLFVHEAIGGVVFGGLIGYLVYRMIKSIEQYQIEVMLTLALVIGGSAMASELHVSAPIAMVVAGLIIGNLGRNKAMNEMTRRYMDGFWELLDDMLNALLFALIGMELLLLPFSWLHLLAASVTSGISSRA